jgi:hypothetical protein
MYALRWISNPPNFLCHDSLFSFTANLFLLLTHVEIARVRVQLQSDLEGNAEIAREYQTMLASTKKNFKVHISRWKKGKKRSSTDSKFLVLGN